MVLFVLCVCVLCVFYLDVCIYIFWLLCVLSVCDVVVFVLCCVCVCFVVCVCAHVCLWLMCLFVTCLFACFDVFVLCVLCFDVLCIIVIYCVLVVYISVFLCFSLCFVICMYVVVTYWDVLICRYKYTHFSWCLDLHHYYHCYMVCFWFVCPAFGSLRPFCFVWLFVFMFLLLSCYDGVCVKGRGASMRCVVI